MGYARGALVNPPEIARSTHLSNRLRSASAKLRLALQHPCLDRLKMSAMTEGVAQVFAGHPHYARFARMARRLLSNGIEVNSDALLDASMRRSWDLFELYCLHRLVESLEAAMGSEWVFERADYQTNLLCGPASGSFWSAAHPSGSRWQLLFQQPFRHGCDDGPTAITTGRQPDFVLCHYAGGSLSSWILLDAKYRSSETAINNSLEAMHIYRDSLRWQIGDNATPAHTGYLLVPTVSPRVERYSNDAFIRRWRIGLIAVDDPSLGVRLLASLN